MRLSAERGTDAQALNEAGMIVAKSSHVYVAPRVAFADLGQLGWLKARQSARGRARKECRLVSLRDATRAPGSHWPPSDRVRLELHVGGSLPGTGARELTTSDY